MPYQILCNSVKREGVKVSPDLASRLFSYLPLHKIWYGILGCPSQALFEIIMALTNIEICDLYKASAHYFTCILTPPEIEIECIELSDVLSVPFLLRGIANKNLRPENAGQF